jgi:CubicO group peptidase (beta-lactamase class C family)
MVALLTACDGRTDTEDPAVRQLAGMDLRARIGAMLFADTDSALAGLAVIAMPAMNDTGPLAPGLADPDSTGRALAGLIAAGRGVGRQVAVRALWAENDSEAVLTWDRARLDAIEFTILRRVIPANPAMLIAGTIRVPSITGDTTPIVFAPAAMTGLFRRRLGWTGPLALDLRKRSDAGAATEGRAVVRAVAAGADILLGARHAATTDSLVAAVEDGRLSSDRIAESALRALRLRLRMRPPTTHDPRPSTDSVASADFTAAIARHEAAGVYVAYSSDTASHEAATGSAASPSGATAALRLVSPDSAGFDAEDLSLIDELMDEAITDSVLTAGAVAVARGGALVHLAGYGGADPVSTLFDLASLTKVVGTTMAAAILVDDGRLELDASVQRYLPDWCGRCRGEEGDWAERVTIRHLLSHTSGLPSGLWLYGSARSPAAATLQLMRQPPVDPPGERAEYSDLGMMLLARAIEATANEDIDRFLAREVFAPLGMSRTMYLPPIAFRDDIVPTAERTQRDFTLQGVVHDPNAFRLGGVAGHAGLFSTARDLAVFAQMILNGGGYEAARILPPAMIDTFRTRQPDTGTRALGWDTPANRSSAGRYFSASSFGHTGYTGTSLWIDPERDLFVIILTNRTLLTASSREVFELRTAIHDAAAQAISDGPAPRRPGSR